MLKCFTNTLLVWRTDTAEIFSFSIGRCYEAGWKPGHSYAASAVHNQHTSSPKLTSCYHSWASAAAPSLTRQHRPCGAPGCVQASSWHHSVLILTEKYKYDARDGLKFQTMETQRWVVLIFHPTAHIWLSASPRQLHAPAAPCRTSGRC